MENFENVSSNLFTSNLEEMQKSYSNLLDSTNKFIKRNTKINKNKKTKYDCIYKDLFDFYKLAVNISHLDLHSFPIQKRLSYSEKKEFSLEIKGPLRELLNEFGGLIHPDKENPFYELG